jgi:hypothetical protein
MAKACLQKGFILLLSCVVLNIIAFQPVCAQVQGTQQQKIKWMSTNALYSWFSNMGTEIEFGRRERQTYIAVDQIDGLCWPNEYHTRMKGIKAGKSLWIGTTNFDDPVAKVTYPYKVVCAGPRGVYSGSEIIADDLFMVGRFKHPAVSVDYLNASYIDADDIIDKEDNNQSADRMIVTIFHTSIGVTVTRKVLAFSQQYHDNYYIYEYAFKNTGIIDESGQKKLNKTLTGVIFYMQYRLAFPGESYSATGTGGWSPATSSWGRNTIHDAVGQDANHILPPPNDFRAFFSYYGPMSTTPYGSPAGDIGLPGPSSINVYTLAGTQFAGVVVLHADKSPADPSDDKSQPTTTKIAGSDNVINSQPSQYNQSLMQSKYLTFMTAGHPAQTQAEEIGKDANGWPNGYANTYGTDAGGYVATQGFGPYTLAPGESVHIVLAEAVAGISHEKINEVAKNWFADSTSQFYLPKGFKNGALTADKNEYKNAWVFSGKDSLFQTFRKAISNYNGNYNIPQPPPPPDKFEVTLLGKYLKLSWSNNAESRPRFNGYRIYRATERTDTSYNLIFSCNAGNVVNTFIDTTAKYGVKYFYFVQTKDDGSTNDIQPGVPLVSSKYFTMTNREAVCLNRLSRFQSHESGNWNNPDAWEYFNTTWVHPAPYTPTDTDGVVVIQSGHSITVTQSESVGQLLVANGGTLIIQPNALVKIKGGESTDLDVFGLLINQGAITMQDSLTAVFEEGSKYSHVQDGGAIPKALWKKGTICEITGVINSMPVNTNQNFYSLIWNCPNQSKNLTLNGQNGFVVSGTLTVTNTNYNHSSTSNPSYCLNLFHGNGSCIINNLTINGYNAILSSQDGNFADTVFVKGDITVSSGGVLLLSNFTAASTQFLLKGNITLPDSGYIGTNDAISQSEIIFSGNTILNIPPSFTFIGAPNFRIAGGGRLSLGNYILTGPGNFTLDAMGTIEITHAGGLDSTIRVSGVKTLSDGSTYIFSGSVSQATGKLLPNTVKNLIINNISGVTLSDSIIVKDTLEMRAGPLHLGQNKLSYGSNGTLFYSENSPDTTSDAEFPIENGPFNLTTTKAEGIHFHSSRTVLGNIFFDRLILGDNTLTANSSGVYNTGSYIVTNGHGVLKLIRRSLVMNFPIGTELSSCRLQLFNAKPNDTISVRVSEDTTKTIGGRVKLKWIFDKNAPFDNQYSIQFVWSGVYEDFEFQKNRDKYAKIFNLYDTTEVGSGSYALDLTNDPRSIRRGGINLPGTFAIGEFKITNGVNAETHGPPTEFKLAQNYPNPFNPVTTIKYQAPNAGSVTLKIFDILGREIGVLVNEEKQAGYYTVQWGASGIPSGIYFYRMRSGKFVETKKMILIK